MSTFVPRAQLIGLIAIAACVLFIFVQRTERTRHDAAMFFSSALKEANITASVTIGSIKYDVTKGMVSSGDRAISDRLRYRVLRLAFALALAHRAPLLDTAGVDPHSLSGAADKLSSTMQLLIDEQKSAHDVQLLEALYPIGFLEDLAELRSARLSFLASGSDADALTYERALERAVSEEGRAIMLFQRTFAEETAAKDFRFPTLGGTITRAGMLDAIRSIRDSVSRLKDRVDRRKACLNGTIAYCDETELALKPVQKEILPVPKKGTGDPRKELMSRRPGDISVELSESVCLGPAERPYIFTSGDPTGRNRMPVWYSGNIFFAPTGGSSGDTMQYLRTHAGITYSIVNPLEYYICPDAMTDIASVNAIIATVRFAQQYPQYGAPKRATLLSGPVYQESDAASYINAATEEIAQLQLSETDPALYDLTEVLHMWENPIAGIEMVISTIVYVNSRDMELRAQGVPINITARNLLMTHSAFPSLYLTMRSSGDEPPTLRSSNAADLAALSDHMIPYTDLAKTVSSATLLHDMAAFLSFEGISE